MNAFNIHQVKAFLELLRRDAETKPIMPRVLFNANCPSWGFASVPTAAGRLLIVHNESSAILFLAGAWWHDEPGHCPTWTDGGGCCCDVAEIDQRDPRLLTREGLESLPTVSSHPVGPPAPPRAPQPPPKAVKLAEEMRAEFARRGITADVTMLPVDPATFAELAQLAIPPPPQGLTTPGCTCDACKSRAAQAIFGGPHVDKAKA